MKCANRLTTEPVKCAALSLKGVDNVEGGNGLSLGVLGVCDCVSDDTLEEGLQNTTGLFVDHWRWGLDAVAEGRGRWGAYWLRYA